MIKALALSRIHLCMLFSLFSGSSADTLGVVFCCMLAFSFTVDVGMCAHVLGHFTSPSLEAMLRGGKIDRAAK